MRLALSTALLVCDGDAPDDAIAGLIDGFSALELPVIRVRSGPGPAFAGTGLEASLEEQGILTLVVTGGATGTIVRDALNLGFRVFTADDAEAIAEVAAALDHLKRRRA